MNVILKYNFEPVEGWTTYFKQQTLEKGKNLQLSGHVHDVAHLLANSELVGKCIPQTRINEPSYDIMIKLDKNNYIIGGSCTCKAGIVAKCKHAAALIAFVNGEEVRPPKTSLPQNWGKPGLRKDYKICATITSLFQDPAVQAEKSLVDKTAVNKVSIKRMICAEFPDIMCPIKKVAIAEKEIAENGPSADTKEILDSIEKSLGRSELVMLKKAARPCAETLVNNLIKYGYPEKVGVAFSKYNVSEELCNLYSEKVFTSIDAIKDLCVETVLQSRSDKWKIARKIRISASSDVHRIKTCTSTHQDLAVKLCEKKVNPPKPTDAMIYGLKMESTACGILEKAVGKKITHLGLFVSPFHSWLCCSPDGIIDDNILVEIKCPKSIENDYIITESRKVNVKYVKLLLGKPQLVQSHIYFTQCQMSMYILGIPITYFFIYTKKQQLLLQVYRDHDFIVNLLSKIEPFVFNVLLPEMKKQNIL